MKRLLCGLGLTIAISAVIASPARTYEITPEQKPEPTIPAILTEIAYCESGNRQFDSSGKLVRGHENPLDVGRYQINEFYHRKTAETLGIDIYTDEGNTEYALYLFKTQGTRPWNWSKPCWGKKVSID